MQNLGNQCTDFQDEKCFGKLRVIFILSICRKEHRYKNKMFQIFARAFTGICKWAALSKFLFQVRCQYKTCALKWYTIYLCILNSCKVTLFCHPEVVPFSLTSHIYTRTSQYWEFKTTKMKRLWKVGWSQ